MAAITYLFLAHAQPHHLARLVGLLLDGSEDAAIVHVDAKTDPNAFRTALGPEGGRLSFVEKPVDVRWAGFSAVRATLRMLETAVSARPARRYVLLSGADYPIRPVSALREELVAEAVWMDTAPMPSPDKPLSRLEHVQLAPVRRGARGPDLLNRVLRRAPRRDVGRGLEGFTPWAGAQWWAMPHEVATAVLRFTVEHPRFVRFFAGSAVPDESFFHTVIAAAAPDVEVRPSLTFADWSVVVPPGSPRTLDDHDLPLLREAARTRFIARKFHERSSGRLLDEVDRSLLRGTAG